MRSIFAKVFAWSLATIAVAFVAFWAIKRSLDHHGPIEGNPFDRMSAFIEADARLAYETGGPAGLAAMLGRIDRTLSGEHLLTDPTGRDLVTGADRSDLLVKGPPGAGPPRLPDGRMVLLAPRRSGGERYRFIALVDGWREPTNLLPYYGAIVLAIAGMGAALAAHLAVPLGRLRRVVDRFGSGDRAARVNSARRDEIGELSRSFDAMAGRIETLMTAERRLLQDVSHELRSPLARLVVAADLARSDADPGPSLARIERDVARLSALVDELLQLTRAEGDPSSFRGEDLALDDLIREVVDDCLVEAEAAGSGLASTSSGRSVVHGDRELLRRAIENVVRNAIRHTAPGTSVEVASRSEDGMVSVDVRDRGPGVPPEHLGAIFEPFFRVEGHRSRASGGVGLGLAIARRAVELHGGRVEARNADPAPGLVVSIDLPTRTG